MNILLLGSDYWLQKLNEAELELIELMSGDLSCVKTAKTDEDTTTLQDIQSLIKAKLKYISYCKQRYEEELVKENQVESKKSILYFDRECGY